MQGRIRNKVRKCPGMPIEGRGGPLHVCLACMGADRKDCLERLPLFIIVLLLFDGGSHIMLLDTIGRFDGGSLTIL